MKFFITSAYPLDQQKNFAATWLLESAAADPFGVHQVCADPQEADIILFAEHHSSRDPYYFQVLRAPVYRKYKHKCYLYHDNDRVLPLMPGIFPSVERNSFHPFATQSGPYIARLCNNDAVGYQAGRNPERYLFSFMGASRTHPIRQQVLGLKHRHCFLKDTSGINSWQLDPVRKKAFEGEYAEVSMQSKFILCPRGIGPSTYRLFETMEMGIAPVIISDAWVPINGPDWRSFSIQVPEQEVNEIPSLLENRAAAAAEMGKRARKAWEQWFSKEVSFHHMAEACVQLHENRHKLNTFFWLKIWAQFLRPSHFRGLLRFTRKRLSPL